MKFINANRVESIDDAMMSNIMSDDELSALASIMDENDVVDFGGGIVDVTAGSFLSIYETSHYKLASDLSITRTRAKSIIDNALRSRESQVGYV